MGAEVGLLKHLHTYKQKNAQEHERKSHEAERRNSGRRANVAKRRKG